MRTTEGSVIGRRHRCGNRRPPGRGLRHNWTPALGKRGA